MMDDPILLARIQFAANISFHILFPTISIALGWVLLFFKLRCQPHRRTRPGWSAYQLLGQGVRAHLRAGRGLRHHHELPVRHQLAGLHGTGRQHRRPAAGLRGADRLLPRGHASSASCCSAAAGSPNRVHTLATFLVAFGTTLSAFWILALNSWMQTPAGYEMRRRQLPTRPTGGRSIFNPSFPYRLTHMLLASGLTVVVPGRRPVGAGSCCAATARGRCGEALRTGVFTGRGADPAADLRRRPARPQHAGAPAGQDRRDGRHLGDRARRAAGAVRAARRSSAGRTGSRSRSRTAPA